MTVYATLADVDARYPDELARLAAGPDGLSDDARIDAALVDVSTEIDAVLLARWRRDELARIDAASVALLRSFAVRMSLHMVSLAFSRASEPVEKSYNAAKASLKDLTKEPLWRTVQSHPSAAVFPGPGGEGLAAMQHRALEAVREHDARIAAEAAQ